MVDSPLLELKNVGCQKQEGQPIFSDVNLVLHEKDILILQGQSGSGKSTLLKCISHLNVHTGEVLYRDQTPQSYGIPTFRTKVMYVPQRPSLLPGTPRDFLATVYTFSAHKSRRPSGSGSSKAASAVKSVLVQSKLPDVSAHEAFSVAEAWGVQRELWDRTWANLSGGEAQRLVLAIAVGMGTAEVLLLDEPTSALDTDSSSKIEKHLVAEVNSPDSTLKAVLWITHSPEQGHRVGTRFVRVTSGGVHEESVDPGV